MKSASIACLTALVLGATAGARADEPVKVPVVTATPLDGPLDGVDDYCKKSGFYSLECKNKHTWTAAKVPKKLPGPITTISLLNRGCVFAIKAGSKWWYLEMDGGPVSCQVDEARAVGSRLLIRYACERSNWRGYSAELGVIVCGVGASGGLSCVGPVRTAAFIDTSDEGSKPGHELPPTPGPPQKYLENCRAELDGKDRLIVKEWHHNPTGSYQVKIKNIAPPPRNSCKELELAGIHELVFP